MAAARPRISRFWGWTPPPRQNHPAEIFGGEYGSIGRGQTSGNNFEFILIWNNQKHADVLKQREMGLQREPPTILNLEGLFVAGLHSNDPLWRTPVCPQPTEGAPAFLAWWDFGFVF